MVFVNRGFVPLDFKDPETRPEGQIEGEVTITGLVREPLREKAFMGRARTMIQRKTSSSGKILMDWRKTPGWIAKSCSTFMSTLMTLQFPVDCRKEG